MDPPLVTRHLDRATPVRGWRAQGEGHQSPRPFILIDCSRTGSADEPTSGMPDGPGSGCGHLALT